MKRIALTLASLVLLACMPAMAQAPNISNALTFTTLNYPGAAESNARGMNARGDVVGRAFMPDGSTREFKYSRGSFTDIVVPGASFLRVLSINQAGDVAGDYGDQNGDDHGFLLSSGKLTLIDVAGPNSTQVENVNDRGQVVGWYYQNDQIQGFVYSAGTITTFGAPGLGFSDPIGFRLSMNDSGQIVSTYQTDGAWHGFVLSNGSYTTVDFPGQPFVTTAISINDGGVIVGTNVFVPLHRHGYILVNGVFGTFDAPGAQSTIPQCVNASGQIAGWYVDTNGLRHGFIAR